MKEHLKKYLESEPRARNRSAKDRGIVNLMTENGTRLPQTKEALIEFVKDYNSYDRLWRLIMQEYPELRGLDYDDKEILSQGKVIELGYEIGNREKEITKAINS